MVKAVTTNNVHNSARIKNSAPILPARTLKLTIVNRTQVEGEKIGSEEIYFDRQTLFEQLGAQSELTPAKAMDSLVAGGFFARRS